MKIITFLFIGLVMLNSSCNSQSTDHTIKILFTEKQRINSVELPAKLSEISGLAFSDDDRLFAHDDEKSIVYQLDYTNGEIIKKFTVGKKTIKEDFEGIAIANGIFYLVSSNGNLYEFSEGKDNEEVKYKRYKTFLDKDNDVEGLCYYSKSNSLLLACKGDPGKKYKGNRTVYEFSLNDKELKKKPIFTIPVEKIKENYNSDFASKIGEFFLIKDDTFAPSAIEYNQAKGNFFVLSFKGRIIVELTRSGEIVKYYFLESKSHRQPEGITFTKDNKMIISDEAAGKKATLTVYDLQ